MFISFFNYEWLRMDPTFSFSLVNGIDTFMTNRDQPAHIIP